MAMPKATLAYEEMTSVLSYEPTTGEFRWNSPRGRQTRSSEVGSIDQKGRRFIAINRRNYPAGRLAWFYVTKSWPDGLIVPDNGDALDLRFENLRVMSPQDVARRSRDRSGTSSGGVRGVSWDKSKGKWTAGITINYRRKALGYFTSKEAAAAAYLRAREELFPSDSQADVSAQREKATKAARYRSLWKRTLRDAAGVTGWDGLDDFAVDIGDDIRDRLALVPVDTLRPIGPGNWKWDVTLYSQFDTSTREGRNAYERAVKRKSPHIWRDRHFRQTFGISLADYMRKLDQQGGVCACCGLPETATIKGEVRWLSVDHCHASGDVRDLLCGNCNQGLGRFRDDPALLRKAAEYLERHKSSDGDALVQPENEERSAHHGSHTL